MTTAEGVITKLQYGKELHSSDTVLIPVELEITTKLGASKLRGYKRIDSKGQIEYIGSVESSGFSTVIDELHEGDSILVELLNIENNQIKFYQK